MWSSSTLSTGFSFRPYARIESSHLRLPSLILALHAKKTGSIATEAVGAVEPGTLLFQKIVNRKEESF
jgi:hypothetical protein